MFYSESILLKKGPLAKVWLAAHWERKLSKANFLQANIETSVGAILGNDRPPMALRLSGQLLLGVVRIYSRKTRYLLEDCNEAIVKIKMTFQPGSVNLPDEQMVTNDAITLKDTITEFDILLPERTFDSQTWGDKFQLSLSQPATNISIIDKEIETPKRNKYDMLIDPLEYNPTSPEINLFNTGNDLEDTMEIESLRDLQDNEDPLFSSKVDDANDPFSMERSTNIEESINVNDRPTNDMSFNYTFDPLAQGNDILQNEEEGDVFKMYSENDEVNNDGLNIKSNEITIKEETDDIDGINNIDIKDIKIKKEEGVDEEDEGERQNEVMNEKQYGEDVIIESLPDVAINDYQLDIEQETQQETEVNNIVRQQRQQKKRKIVLYDNQIELLGESISSQLKDPSNTLVKDELLLFRPSKYMKLLKSANKDNLFVENNDIIFSTLLYQEIPTFKMPPTPPPESIFKDNEIELLIENDENDISKVNITLEKEEINEGVNLLDTTELNLPEIGSFDFNIDTDNRDDKGEDKDDEVKDEDASAEGDDNVNISLDDTDDEDSRMNEKETEEGTLITDNIDNDDIPIISAVEQDTTNEQNSWANYLRDEFKEKTTVLFKESTKQSKRKEAVNFFFEVLAMTSKNMLRVEQNEAYGEISIYPKDNLYKSTQTV